jgi:hypothetical protein
MIAVSSSDVTIDADHDAGGLNFKVSNFFGDAATACDGPQGFLLEIEPLDAPPEAGERMTMVDPHFHLVRQYQVFVGGDDLRIGKKDLETFDFHYTDPSTPYGPIDSGRSGVKFFTLRPRSDTGAFFMPGNRDKMTARAGRNVVVKANREIVVNAGAQLGNASPAVLELIERHDDGLASYLLKLAPDETVVAPDPAGSGGQYQLVARGSVIDDGKECPPRSLIWVDGDEPPASLTAGPDGAEVLVLQFPLPMPVAEEGAGTRGLEGTKFDT